jgi:membrane-bound metal-dependent hydrolase YbcI (DUF457 family)
MPSPIGHALAGALVVLSAEHLPRRLGPVRASLALALVCIGLAVLPDADLLYMPVHRTVTHSFTAVAVVMIIAAGVTRQVTGAIAWGVVLACGAASLSHILLDWLGEDFNQPRGIQALWPFSDRWMVSGWDVFRSTERHDPLSIRSMTHNAITAGQEILLLGPIVLALWLMRKRLRPR